MELGREMKMGRARWRWRGRWEMARNIDMGRRKWRQEGDGGRMWKEREMGGDGDEGV